MQDREGNTIQPVGVLNNHTMIVGGSGTGKTYSVIRKIEEDVLQGKSVWVIDFSGSFNADELSKHGINTCFYVVDLKIQKYEYYLPRKEMGSILYNSLKNTLDISSYNQEAILESVIMRVERNIDGLYCNSIDIPTIWKELCEFTKELEPSREQENLIKNAHNLLTKLKPYREIDNIKFVPTDVIRQSAFSHALIIQLMNHEQQSLFVSKLLLSVFWQEVYIHPNQQDYKVICLDEFQKLGMNGNTLVQDMLREGRKKGIELVLSTQFVSHCNRETLQCLQQVDNMLIFRLTDGDSKMFSEQIDMYNSKQWEQIIRGLKKGEAIFRGNYVVNGGAYVESTPIIVQI